jgi:hypothetical protein
MVNQQLLDYVRQQVAAGISKDVIKKALATQGWSEQDVNEAFSVIEHPALHQLYNHSYKHLRHHLHSRHR